MTINELREKTGMSQSQFAEHFGISLRTLQSWEQGRRQPPQHDLTMIARIIELEGMASIKFKDEQHEKDYLRFLGRMRNQDRYHKAVAYLLALDEAVKNHAEDVFDFAQDWVKVETALGHGWQTGTSLKTTRLLMNLWNGWCREFDDDGNDFVSASFAVDEIFSCEYAPYYWEAIKLRFPEYCI